MATYDEWIENLIYLLERRLIEVIANIHRKAVYLATIDIQVCFQIKEKKKFYNYNAQRKLES